MRIIGIRSLGLHLWMTAAIVLCGAFAAWPADQQASSASDQSRSDILIIDGLSAFGPLERPAVVFYHDKHTQVMTRQKKDCLACHPMVKDRLSLKFQRSENLDKQSVMDLYHDQCIACHQQNSGPDKTSGPVTCGQCHVQAAAPQSNWQPIGLDKSLHFRHVKANEQKCEQCHHEYNTQTKTLFYTKGREGACLYCHQDQTQDNRMSNRLASHTACIGCHRQRIGLGQHAGPVDCAGCHDPAQQALIEKAIDPLRIERNQPDLALVKTHFPANLPVDGSVQPQATMPPVAFDHKAHEGYSNSCRVCHHADLTACARCHSLKGGADGKQVKLAQAMHQKDASMSCIGCHQEQQARPQCAGCHAGMAPARTLTSERACRVCHLSRDPQLPVPTDEAQAKIEAARLLAARPPAASMVPVDQIPETVTIKPLTKQYEPVVMPHRRIVLKLQAQIAGNPLGDRFHTDSTTLCQGCHHNSPGSAKPPQCGSCHGRSSEALNPNRPGLLAAYHQQCLECHDLMGIAKPVSRDCTACHAKRAS